MAGNVQLSEAQIPFIESKYFIIGHKIRTQRYRKQDTSSRKSNIHTQKCENCELKTCCVPTE